MTSPKKEIRWLTIVALVAVIAGTWFNWMLTFGILFLLGAIGNLVSGSAYLVEPIERARNPVLYWMIVLLWLFLSIWMIVGPYLGWPM